MNVYEWERADSDIKEFGGASLEWLDMVVNCRSDLNFKHEHDIVIGKIANDNVGETVAYVIQGIMRKEGRLHGKDDSRHCISLRIAI